MGPSGRSTIVRMLASVTCMALVLCTVQGQVECDVTKRINEGKFVSAFRNAYLDMFDGNRGNDLRKEAKRAYDRADFGIVNNRGETCKKRYEYTLELCLACTRRLGWRVPAKMFNGRKGRQRRFINDFRRRACEDKDACVRKPRPSPSPIPGPYVKIVSSDESVSDVVSYRFALVSESSEDEFGQQYYSTRLFYSVEDMVTGFGAFGDTIIETRSDELDVEFFECASNMLDRAGLGDLAAAAVRETCYDASSGSNFNNRCANERLSHEICDGLRVRNCAPIGDSLNSQCVL